MDYLFDDQTQYTSFKDRLTRKTSTFKYRDESYVNDEVDIDLKTILWKKTQSIMKPNGAKRITLENWIQLPEEYTIENVENQLVVDILAPNELKSGTEAQRTANLLSNVYLSFVKIEATYNFILEKGEIVQVREEGGNIWNSAIVQSFNPEKFCIVSISNGIAPINIPAFAYANRIRKFKFHLCYNGSYEKSISEETQDYYLDFLKDIQFASSIEDIRNASSIQVYNEECGDYISAEVVRYGVNDVVIQYSSTVPLLLKREKIDLKGVKFTPKKASISDLKSSRRRNLLRRNRNNSADQKSNNEKLPISRKIKTITLAKGIDVQNVSTNKLKERHDKYIKVLKSIGFELEYIDSSEGKSLFRALSLQIFGNIDNHRLIKKKTYEHIKENHPYYKRYVEDFDSYIMNKHRCAEYGYFSYGDHLDIQAASEIWNCRVEIYSELSRNSAEPVTFYKDVDGLPFIRLSYAGLHHYDSLKHKDMYYLSLHLNSNIKTMNILNLRQSCTGDYIEDQNLDQVERISIVTYDLLRGYVAFKTKISMQKFLTMVLDKANVINTRLRRFNKIMYAVTTFTKQGHRFSLVARGNKQRATDASRKLHIWIYGTTNDVNRLNHTISYYCKTNPDVISNSLSLVSGTFLSENVRILFSTRHEYIESTKVKVPGVLTRRSFTPREHIQDIADAMTKYPDKFWNISTSGTDLQDGFNGYEPQLVKCSGLVDFGGIDYYRGFLVFSELLRECDIDDIGQKFIVEFQNILKNSSHSRRFESSLLTIVYPAYPEALFGKERYDTTQEYRPSRYIEMIRSEDYKNRFGSAIPIEVIGPEDRVLKALDFIKCYSLSYISLEHPKMVFTSSVSISKVLQIQYGEHMVDVFLHACQDLEKQVPIVSILTPSNSFFTSSFIFSTKLLFKDLKSILKQVPVDTNDLNTQEILTYRLSYEPYEWLDSWTCIAGLNIEFFKQGVTKTIEFTMRLVVLLRYHEYSNGDICLVFQGIDHGNTRKISEGNEWNEYWDIPISSGFYFKASERNLYYRLHIQSNNHCWLNSYPPQEALEDTDADDAEVSWQSQCHLLKNAFSLFHEILQSSFARQDY